MAAECRLGRWKIAVAPMNFELIHELIQIVISPVVFPRAFFVAPQNLKQRGHHPRVVRQRVAPSPPDRLEKLGSGGALHRGGVSSVHAVVRQPGGAQLECAGILAQKELACFRLIVMHLVRRPRHLGGHEKGNDSFWRRGWQEG